MYTETFPAIRTSPSIVPVRVAATAAFALMGITQLVGGTGSVFDVTRAGEWRRLVEARTPLHVEIEVDGEEAARPDLRSASEHLANIREVLNPAIADLAGTFGVSRQAIYKWLGESRRQKRTTSLGYRHSAKWPTPFMRQASNGRQ
ncbi:hypothetical protein [Pseudomonas aeruginosa]|uniref:hypothetical protein n=1 Tax=Pseudomonas aeruginosa TaxID=287 RepID=UPI00211166F3|nr:hypothetical protein [Pseudomonas aeruginosa]MCT9629557.1 hypothetical protein [Pseudomonas aeruginosa]